MEKMGKIHQIEYLCPICTPKTVTVLVRFNEKEYYCTYCKTLFNVDDVIASNYEWLNILEQLEGNNGKIKVYERNDRI